MRLNFTFISLLLLFLSACEKQSSMQTVNTVSAVPSATGIPPEQIEQKFLEHYGQGLNIITTGNFPENVPKAIEEFEKAAVIKPKDDRPQRRIADAYVSLEKWNEAAGSFRRVLKLSPDDKYIKWALTRMLIEHLGEYENGLRMLFSDEKLYGSDELTTMRPFYKAKAFDGMGDVENAVKNYKLFLETHKLPDSDLYKTTKKELENLKCDSRILIVKI